MTIDSEMSRMPRGWRIKKLTQMGDPLDNSRPINKWGCILVGPEGATLIMDAPTASLAVRRAIQDVLDGRAR